MVHEIITQRKSTVLFSGDSVDKNIITELFGAARLAPSSLNIQPWRFIYSEKGDDYYPKMLQCLSDANQEWARNAPVLLTTVAELISDYKNRPNKYAIHDTAMAYSNMVFQAISLGLSIHPMGGFERDLAIRLLEIPENYEPVIFAALGYRSANTDFSEKLVEKEKAVKPRKPIQEIAFHGYFGNKNNDL